MNSQVLILILEDNASDYELIRRELRSICLDYTVQWAHDKETFLQALGKFTPNLVLLDYSLPGFDGLSALAVCRQYIPDMPAIIVSGAIGEEVAIETLKAGATDYVLKQHLSRLGPVIHRALQEAEQLIQRKRAEEALRRNSERLEILSQTASRLLASDRPQEIVNELCIRVMKFLDCHVFFNYLVDEDAGKLHLNAYAGIRDETARSIEWMDYGIEACGCVARDGQRIIAENIPATPDPRTDLVKSFGIKAYVCHPLTDQEKIIGTLSFGTCSRTSFDDDDLSIMRAVADQVAIAMARIRSEHELLRAKDELEQRVQEWEQTFDTVPDLLAILDLQHRIVRVNQAMADRLGVAPAQCTGQACYMAVHGLAHPPQQCPHSLTCRDGHQHVGEIHEPRLGGDFLVSTSPLYDPRGQLIGTVHVARDITERKRMEEELECKVRERTAELQDAKENLEVINEELQMEISEHEKTEKELMVAKEAAEAAAEAKAAFLSNMSHELRTPLNAVIGFSSLLLSDNLTDEQKEFIERIRNGGEALLSIIADILEFSRVEKEKVELERQPISLKLLIEESMDMVAAQANDKGLDLAYTINYGTPDTIIGDPGRLRQILTNLLSNAVKFTDTGDISVAISSKIIEGNKRQITFAVKDTGIGMPQDKMDRLFKPFTQLEYVISRKRDGAGLGLAICKKLVELMDGRIWAESEEGIGSTFRFTIQTETLPGKQLDLSEMDKAAVYENLSGQKPLAILVAEDNPSNQKALVEMLKRLGYRPDAVADGVEVLQALQIRPYDIIFMDIRMPEMDGLTATKEIRKLWPDNGPKIIAITAFAMDRDQEICLEAGMDGYIAKPVRVSDLATLLHNITSE